MGRLAAVTPAGEAVAAASSWQFAKMPCSSVSNEKRGIGAEPSNICILHDIGESRG
jgi:hypothetical protein